MAILNYMQQRKQKVKTNRLMLLSPIKDREINKKPVGFFVVV